MRTSGLGNLLDRKLSSLPAAPGLQWGNEVGEWGLDRLGMQEAGCVERPSSQARGLDRK